MIRENADVFMIGIERVKNDVILLMYLTDFLFLLNHIKDKIEDENLDKQDIENKMVEEVCYFDID